MPLRPKLLIIAGVSLAAMVFGGYSMATRVGAFNKSADRELFVYASVIDRTFTYADREVRFVDSVKESLQAEGEPGELPFGAERVTIHYGDDTLELVPTMQPDPAELPGLTRHMNWMRVVRFAPRSGLSIDELEEAIQSREVTDRLAIVVFEPPRGADPRTYGEVWKRDAWFSFHELLPGGGFRSQRLKFPESKRSFERRTQQALRDGEPAPTRPEYELEPRSWQYGAAQIVRSGRDQPTMLPGSMTPDLAFSSDAIGSMGWTLPLTSIATLAFAVSLALAFAPRRPKEGADE
jgi:hypothetical protein